jgi:hypothetical protein
VHTVYSTRANFRWLSIPFTFGEKAATRRSIHELAARKAIRALEGHDLEDVSEYTDHNSEKYKKMVEWIAKDLDVSTLRCQTVDDMVEAIGRPREDLCLYCWTGKCPKSESPKPPIKIAEAKQPSAKKPTKTETVS